jgi:hypothetical protein
MEINQELRISGQVHPESILVIASANANALRPAIYESSRAECGLLSN